MISEARTRLFARGVRLGRGGCLHPRRRRQQSARISRDELGGRRRLRRPRPGSRRARRACRRGACAVARSKTAIVVPPSELDDPELHDAGDPVLARRARPRPRRSSRRRSKPSSPPSPVSIATSRRAAGHSPSTSRERVERLVRAAVEAERDARVRAGEQVAVLADQPRPILDRGKRRRGRLERAPRRRSTRRGKRRRLGSAALDEVASFELTTASAFSYESAKMRSKLFEIVSVRM